MLLALVVGGPDMAARVWNGIEGSAGVSTPRTPTSTGDGTFAGVVTQITDGDTFRIGDRAVRICGVNAPEQCELGYREAGAYLGRLIDGRSVSCRGVGSGSVCDGRSDPTSYNRVVATCFVNGQDVATELVRGGHAVDWPRYSGGHYAR
ncbi:thermonuclease family protein [Aureimonas altamirensis]|uniref:thermonuclease family protein n=1 Tax=Aureimonas altamirensis TaxID=370622 RepID=UPI0020369249|nr:thermonuclease family protein [Aureimonas altamirensis]